MAPLQFGNKLLEELMQNWRLVDTVAAVLLGIEYTIKDSRIN
jgi:hypothetical protein